MRTETIARQFDRLIIWTSQSGVDPVYLQVDDQNRDESSSINSFRDGIFLFGLVHHPKEILQVPLQLLESGPLGTLCSASDPSAKKEGDQYS